MTKKVSEVIIKVTGKGIKAVNTDVSNLLANIEETTAAAKGLQASLEEGGRADAVLGRIADSTERTEKEFRQLNKTSANTLKIMEEQLQQTAFATEDARESSDRLGKSYSHVGKDIDGLNRRLGGVNRQGNNQVRTFSKMARTAGGLTMVYATIAANVFALSEAFRLMNEAASVSRLAEVSSVMSNDLGVSIKGTANALYEATDAAISYQEALKLAAASAAYGFDTTQMEKLALVAKRASVVLGVDMQDALRRVTRGIAKQEVELLDELGLTIRMNEAFSKYAATHGLAAKSLNAFQRQAAFTNEVVKKSEEGLSSVDAVLASTEWEKFGAEVSTAASGILQAVSSSDLLVSSLKKLREGMQAVRESGNNQTIVAAAHTGGVGAVADNLQTPGAEQFREIKPDDTRALVAAYAAINVEITNAKAKLEGMEATSKDVAWYSGFLYSNEQGTSEEYAVQSLTLNGLLEIQRRLAETSGLTADQAHRTNEALRELGALGKTFTNELDTYGNKLFGTADTTMQSQIDGINAAVARASKASGGQFTDEELLAKAKTTSEELLGKAKSIADYQQIAYDYRSAELGIIDRGLSAEQHKLELAEAARNAAVARLEILRREGASETVILQKTKERVAAEQQIRSIKESILLRSLAEDSLLEGHLARNENALSQAQEALSTAKDNLDIAKESETVSAATLRNLDAEVLAKTRSLQISKEQSAEQEKAAYFAVANDLASNVGALDAGMGQATSGLISMAQGWETLGSSAATSAERIQAASQIAGGFQSALGGLINSASSMVASGIDAEIAAVKQSGLTQEEQEKKVKKLQKRKIKEQEKYTKASILLNTAMGVAGALAMQPWTPFNFVLAGLTAAAGVMAYQQASNTASSQLANLGSGGGGSESSMSVSVGSASTPSTDVSSAASSGERSQMLGDRGVYGRASAGSMQAQTPYLTSESGRELVVPETNSKVFNASDTEALLAGKGGDTFAPVIQVSALDAQSLEERMPEILAMLQEQAEQQGFSLSK